MHANCVLANLSKKKKKENHTEFIYNNNNNSYHLPDSCLYNLGT